jgi:hypothetical protein
MAAENRRMQRMAAYEEELIVSSFFELAEEVIPPAARAT